MTIVLADGTVAKTGGKVVKNVAGYDLHKLMIGAFGTLGWLPRSISGCTPSRSAHRVFSVSAPDAEPLGKLMLRLLHAQLSTVAIQLRGTAAGFELDVQLASLAEVLHTQAAALETMAQSEGLRSRGATDDVWVRGSSRWLMSLSARARCFRRRLRGLPNGFVGWAANR